MHPPLCLLHQDLLDGPVKIVGVDTVSGSEQSSLLKLVRVDVDPDDRLRLGGFAAHDGGQSDRSEPEHGTRGIFFHLDAQNLRVSRAAVRETSGEITTPGLYGTSCLYSFKHVLYIFISIDLILAHFILMQFFLFFKDFAGLIKTELHHTYIVHGVKYYERADNY